MTDGDVANQIFRTYDGVTRRRKTPSEDSPSHAEDEHTLMQRASDIDFLRRLARRTGRWCRVVVHRHAGAAHRLLRPARPRRRTPRRRSI